jgi:DNA-directed RNA polymerase specialized sigma24 family protein
MALSKLEIENNKRLEVLYRESHLWLCSATFNIVKNKETANDLVGDLYVYLGEKVRPHIWWGKSFNVMYCYSFVKSRFLNKIKRDKKIKYQADNPIDNRVDTEYDEEWDVKLEESYNEVVAELKNMERSRNWPASKLAQIYWFTPNMTLEKLSNEIKICKSTSFTNVKKAKLHLRETLNNPFIEKE